MIFPIVLKAVAALFPGLGVAALSVGHTHLETDAFWVNLAFSLLFYCVGALAARRARRVAHFAKTSSSSPNVCCVAEHALIAMDDTESHTSACASPSWTHEEDATSLHNRRLYSAGV